MIAGIAGAVILPGLSDCQWLRVPFISLCLAADLGLVGIIRRGPTYSSWGFGNFLGFFLLSAGLIGLQYGAEIAYPAPEGTSRASC